MKTIKEELNRIDLSRKKLEDDIKQMIKNFEKTENVTVLNKIDEIRLSIDFDILKNNLTKEQESENK